LEREKGEVYWCSTIMCQERGSLNNNTNIILLVVVWGRRDIKQVVEGASHKF